MATHSHYHGLTRYIVRRLGPDRLYLVWDTETNSSASRTLGLNEACARALRLERLYGTLIKSAA